MKKHKHKKKNIFARKESKNHTQKLVSWLTGGVYIFLILVGLVVVIHKEYKEKISRELQQEIARQENNQRLSVNLPHSSDVAMNWKLFESRQFNFSIKYPQDWEFVESLPKDSTGKYKTKISFLYKSGLNRNTKELDIYVYEGTEFFNPIATNNIFLKKVDANPETCSSFGDVTVGEENYPAKEIYIYNNNTCFKNTYFYSLVKDNLVFNIVPLPSRNINNLGYDGKKEVSLYFPEFFNILSTFKFEEKKEMPKVVIPHRVYIAKESCPKENDHPKKSKQGKGLHMDEDCCIDPDEWPNPRCAYSAKAMDIAHEMPKAKK